MQKALPKLVAIQYISFQRLVNSHFSLPLRLDVGSCGFVLWPLQLFVAKGSPKSNRNIRKAKTGGWEMSRLARVCFSQLLLIGLGGGHRQNLCTWPGADKLFGSLLLTWVSVCAFVCRVGWVAAWSVGQLVICA